MPIPESIFIQTVTGDYPEGDLISPSMGDVYMKPDENTIRLVPWYQEPTAQILCDAFYRDEKPVVLSSLSF